jgi:hypothetical protein
LGVKTGVIIPEKCDGKLQPVIKNKHEYNVRPMVRIEFTTEAPVYFNHGF